MDALQSQINPHFLYNTLDSIVWMIEGERYEDAVFMITQLASLFRISLSRGKTIISIEDEVKHAQNYMNIQRVRYKNKFTIDFKVEEDILSCCTVKLVIHALLRKCHLLWCGMHGWRWRDRGGRATAKNTIFILKCATTDLECQRRQWMLLTENNRVRKEGLWCGSD